MQSPPDGRAAALVISVVVAGCGRFGFEAAASDASATPIDAMPPARRVLESLAVLYTFDEASGNQAFDASGLVPPIDLVLGASTTWVEGGIEIADGATATRSVGSAARVSEACTLTGEVTVEAWLASARVTTTGSERVFGIAGDNNVATATLGQDNTAYYGQVRTSTSSQKLVSTPDTTRTTLRHLLHTRAADGSRVLYIDGSPAATTASTGTFGTWDTALPLTVGNALDGGVQWSGRLFLAAIYCRALSSTEVLTNFSAGP